MALRVTSLPKPSLRKICPGKSKFSSDMTVPSIEEVLVILKCIWASSCSLPILWLMRSTNNQCPSGVTIFQLNKLSTHVPQITACLPPALEATLPPMVHAQRLVGSVANTWGLDASMTLPVTAPACAVMVATSPLSSMFLVSTFPILSNFSTLIITESLDNGTEPPHKPVPPPRGITTKPCC